MHLILETQLLAQGPLVEIHSDPGVSLPRLEAYRREDLGAELDVSGKSLQRYRNFGICFFLYYRDELSNLASTY
jgi:hypothetical protein